MTINGRFMSEPETQAYINSLLARIAELEEKHFVECTIISQYDDELRRAKELLKAANKDIFDMLTERFGTLCEFCKWYNKSDAECASPRNGSGSWCCEYGGWQREGEALALIGEDINVPTTATDTNVDGKGGNDNA